MSGYISKDLKEKEFLGLKNGLSGRKFKTTHPWLTFDTQVHQFPSDLWVLLGEARSKIGHVAGVPLRPVSRKEMRRLSPRISEAYAGLTDKCISRDLNALEANGLVREVAKKMYVANTDLIRAFLPLSIGGGLTGEVHGRGPAALTRAG